MGKLKFSTADINKLLDGRYNNFKESVIGDNTIAVTANTEFLFVNNGASEIKITSPEYITSRWDFTNSKISMPEELDSPSYVIDISPYFTPSTGSEGAVTMRIYIDESGTRDYTSDPLIRTYNVRQKGADLVSIVGTWFFGDDVGFDAKNNGVYFTLEFENNGTISVPFHVIYRT